MYRNGHDMAAARRERAERARIQTAASRARALGRIGGAGVMLCFSSMMAMCFTGVETTAEVVAHPIFHFIVATFVIGIVALEASIFITRRNGLTEADLDLF